MIDHREKQEISDFPSKLSLRQKACEESIMILLATKHALLLLFSSFSTKGMMAYICQGNLWALHLCLVHNTARLHVA